jgi:hypothetical protein
MKEEEMLMCLIAFVLGYLVARMIRGNGLMVGGNVVGGKDEVGGTKKDTAPDDFTRKFQKLETKLGNLNDMTDKQMLKLGTDLADLPGQRQGADETIGQLVDREDQQNRQRISDLVTILKKESALNKDEKAKIQKYVKILSRENQIEKCMKNKEMGNMRQMCSAFSDCRNENKLPDVDDDFLDRITQEFASDSGATRQ